MVLLLQPSLLWTKPCAFCCHNAADGRISSQPLPQLQNLASLSGMFNEIENFSSRQDQRLQPYDTTDVQAEVLVFDTIEPQYIFGAAFNKQEAKAAYEGLLAGRQVQLKLQEAGYSLPVHLFDKVVQWHKDPYISLFMKNRSSLKLSL